MTYNVRIDLEGDPYEWNKRKKWIAEIIKRYQPDVVGTQEMMPHTFRDLMEYLSDEYDAYGKPISEGNHTEICMIFIKKKKLKIKTKNYFMISETPDEYGSKGWDAEYKRSCSWIEVADRKTDQSLFRIFNTHLDHMGVQARVEGSKLILNQIEKVNHIKKLPYILTGDFNSTPESNWISPLLESSLSNSYHDLLQTKNKDKLATFNRFIGQREGSPIDYIFAGESLQIKHSQIIRDTVEGGYPSDHYPVMSEILLN